MSWRGLRGFGSIDSIGTGEAVLSTASLRSSNTEPLWRSATRARLPNGLGGDDGIGTMSCDQLHQVFGGGAIVVAVRREIDADPVAVRNATDHGCAKLRGIAIELFLHLTPSAAGANVRHD